MPQEQQQAVAELVDAVAALAQSNNALVAENAELRRQLGYVVKSVDQYDRQAMSGGRTNQNMST